MLSVKTFIGIAVGPGLTQSINVIVNQKDVSFVIRYIVSHQFANSNRIIQRMNNTLDPNQNKPN